MVVLSDPAWIQGAFNALVAIFDRVGLLNNVRKTVSMVCHPCRVGDRNRTEEAYGWKLTGVGKSYVERQRERVACRECGEALAVGSMSSHLMTRHGKAAARWQLWTPQAGRGPRTYKMSFPAKEGPRRCPVEVCLGFLTTSTAMRVHFVHQHVQDTVVMLEEGNLPLPQFFRCDLQVTRKALNGCHMGTLQCKKEEERKRRRLADTERGNGRGRADTSRQYYKPTMPWLSCRTLPGSRARLTPW